MSQSNPSDTPTPEAPCSPELLSRRKFFERISYAAGGVGGILMALPVVSFLIAPLVHQVKPDYRAVGAVDSFVVGKTVKVEFIDSSPLPWSGVSAKSAAWLRRKSETEFEAFSVNCMHLGCPVRWLESANLFMCPCHGGVYYADGKVAAGPPPEPLHKYQVKIDPDSKQVMVLAEPVPIGRD